MSPSRDEPTKPPDPLGIDNVDGWRGPPASQAAGLTLAAAHAIIDAVQAEARSLGVAMSCAVVDSGDQLVAFERMDAADLAGIVLARDKAYTALTNHMSTADLPPITQPGTEFFGYHTVAGGRTIIFAGGMPLERDGILVGAVGVSGGDSQQDQRAVEAGVEAFAPVLRRGG
ncbi:MAG: heme-binding protein [Chloroflexi bacterium]|nr:heme-binding protein [Chloroflexota bacterium]